MKYTITLIVVVMFITINPQPFERVTVYRHLTVYENEHGVYEVGVDSTYEVGCDGWNVEDDNGHNCVIANSEDIVSILTNSGLFYYAIGR